MHDKLILFWEHAVEEGFPTPLLPLLYPLTLLYRLIDRANFHLYRRKIFRPIHFPEATVISIGNLTVGGSGKTPFSLFLAESLQERERIAFISRGYRAQHHRGGEKARFVTEKSRYGEGYGDEPLLLAHRKVGSVIVARSKSEGVSLGLQSDKRIFLLDDGFQHYRLARDLDVVLLETKSLFQPQSLFPLGRHREPLSALQRAHLIVGNDIDGDETWQKASTSLQKITKAPLIGMRPHLNQLLSFAGEKLLPPSSKKIALLHAIAQPKRVRQLMERESYSIVDELIRSDHAPWHSEIVHSFAHRAKSRGAELLLTSEKDWVKLRELELSLPLPIGYIEMKLSLTQGEAIWNSFLKRIIEIDREKATN